jgi:hypothetical protein
MLDEMRQLVALWSDASLEKNKADVIRSNPLNKATRARVLDVLNRIFVPRFVDGPIENSWFLLAPLERLGAPVSIVRPIYFWITALAEPLLYDFCCDFLTKARERGIHAIDVIDASAWVDLKGNHWSEAVTLKVTRAVLAALRDFGVLEGRARKRVVTPQLPLASFAYITFCLVKTGAVVRNLLYHSDWCLFSLRPGDVERFLLEAHQHRLLEYHVAGSILSLNFPVSTPEEYARVVLGR